MPGKHQNQIFIYRQDLWEHAGAQCARSPALRIPLMFQPLSVERSYKVVLKIHLLPECNTRIMSGMLISSRGVWIEQSCTHTHTHTRILPTTLHPLTFAVFRASRPLCSSLPPFQASAPVPSNLLTHQKAFLFLSACVVFPSSWMCWYLTTLCSEKGDN